MKQALVLSGIVLAVSSGCAKPPNRIAATELPVSIYANESCDELRIQKAESERKLVKLNADQNKAVMDDIAGVVLIGVPVSSLTGDVETALSIEKGKSEAIDKAMIQNGCG